MYTIEAQMNSVEANITTFRFFDTDSVELENFVLQNKWRRNIPNDEHVSTKIALMNDAIRLALSLFDANNALASNITINPMTCYRMDQSFKDGERILEILKSVKFIPYLKR